MELLSTVSNIGSNIFKGIGNVIHTVANKVGDATNFVNKIPILGPAIQSTPIGGILSTVANVGRKMGDVSSDIGHGEFSNAINKGVNLLDTLSPIR